MARRSLTRALGGLLLVTAADAQQDAADAPGPSMGLLEFVAQFSTEEGEWLDPETLNQELGMLDQQTKNDDETNADNPQIDPGRRPAPERRDDDAAGDPDRR